LGRGNLKTIRETITGANTMSNTNKTINISYTDLHKYFVNYTETMSDFVTENQEHFFNKEYIDGMTHSLQMFAEHLDNDFKENTILESLTRG
jgi:hypothetical protein